ncbi:WhiB family transcriptional regulator [Streptomyces sp. NPDC015346]|uniref:WhiB family transcriptional regulator n=1 Tax=Streptomyces sp. NPDC015346 TaxID=3364954 RepID=UPI0036F941F7
MTTAQRAYMDLTDHRHYRYRGCAPDPDQPAMSAGDPGLAVDAWSHGPDSEEQRERRAREQAAIAVCHRCPVAAACRTYANTELPSGALAEPEGIWGGQTALERHRARITRRHQLTDPITAGLDVPLENLARARSAQKRAVLAALAAHTDPETVAAAAGMDVRTANWQRSALVTLLGLDKDRTSRRELLDTALALGILPADTRIVPDGPHPVPAAPRTDRPKPRPPIQLTIPGLPRYKPADHTRPVRTRHPRQVLRLVRPRPVALTLPLPAPRSLEAAA